MPDNERLCALAQAGDATAREQLLERNMGFVRKLALEVYGKAGESGLDVDDLVQEGCIGLLSAIDRFDAEHGMKFLTYAALAIRNAMTDCARAALSQFERRLEFDGLQRVRLDDVLDADERLLRIEAVADPHAQTPEQVVLTTRTASGAVYRAGQPDRPRADLASLPPRLHRRHRAPANRRRAALPPKR